VVIRLVYDAALRPTNRSHFDEDMYAAALGDSPDHLWGITPAARMERQLRSEGIDPWRGNLGTLPANATFLLLRGDCLYDARVIRGLVKARHAQGLRRSATCRR